MIVGIIGLIFLTGILASIYGPQGFFAVSYTGDNQPTGNFEGGTRRCGDVQSGYYMDWSEMIDFCEDYGYDCWVEEDGDYSVLRCQEYCYSCDEYDTLTWAAVPSCEAEGLQDIPVEDLETDNDFSADEVGNIKVPNDLEYCYLTLDCYQCDDGERIHEEYKAYSSSEDCPSGWTDDSSLQCEPDTITCYTCDGGAKVSEEIEASSCPSGYEENSADISCSLECYQCQDGRVVSDSFQEKTCPTGWYPTEPECSQTITCHKCVDGEDVTQEFQDACDEGWYEERQDCTNTVDCFRCEYGQVVGESFEDNCPEDSDWQREKPECNKFIGFFEKVFDFKNNPEQASLAVLAVLSVVISAFMMFGGNGKKEKGGSIGL